MSGPGLGPIPGGQERLPPGHVPRGLARRYRASFRPTFGVFTLLRKMRRFEREDPKEFSRYYRRIAAVDRIAPTAMRCIKVDGRHSLYLAGRAMVPTHNTRSLTEWAWWELWRQPKLICHAIAPTIQDARGTLFEGPAGFLSVVPTECLRGASQSRAYNKTNRELFLANGGVVRGFGAQEEAGRLRGPQCHLLVGDELREWERPAGNLEQALNNALFGLRLPSPDGTPARGVLGTTPKPVPYLKRFERRPGVKVVTGSSYENLENLSRSFRSTLLSLDGTLVGRQEIEGLYIDEEADLSIFKRNWIRLWPYERRLPEFVFVVESYDCAATEENYSSRKQETDPTASIVLGVFNVQKEFPDPAERRRLGCNTRYAALLCEAWSERLGTPDLLDRARSQHKLKWGTPGKSADVVLIENKSSGTALRQFLGTWGVPCWPYNPGVRDKTTRAHAQSPVVKQGQLWVPESTRPDRRGMARDWCDSFLEQVCGFAGPGSVEHDDYVDAIVQALDYLKDRNLLTAVPPETNPDRDEIGEREKRDAERSHRNQNRARFRNPYG